jgi:tetratricopeptide (TPR) repeat protein
MKHVARRSLRNDKRVGASPARAARGQVGLGRRYLVLIAFSAILSIAFFAWLYERRDESPSVESTSVAAPARQPDLAIESEQPPPAGAFLSEINALKKEAFEMAELLIAKFPEDAHCYDVSAAVQYRLGGDASKADDLWKRAIELDPRFLAPYFGRTNIAWSQGDFETVVELMRQVLDRDPSSDEARRLLSNALIESGRFDEAIQAVRVSDQAMPDSVPSCLLLGKAYLQLDDYDQSAKYYERAVQLNPQCWEAYYGLAQASQFQGRVEEARRHLEKFKALQGGGVSADDRSPADRLMESDATLVLQEVIAACLSAGEICQRHGDLERAEQFLIRAAALNPRDPRSRQALQQLYQQRARQNQPAGTTLQQRWVPNDRQRGG